MYVCMYVCIKLCMYICLYMYICVYIYLLLAECEVCTASYGLSFFLPFMAQAQSVQAMKKRKEKTRIHNLHDGPTK